ncbi:hypothetical protein K457DRAFT_126579 [Linnemannia elongata AG-77]|uniref:Uncharacterized protein n=1 Tax=Linnemannia elongata AG-77 TaxID=1314771 RepID=A0A197JVR3_9FUNG|nr:hypothetical protein K457DRAFT_126579 [Linnemannia elongata AG-77]
MSTQDSLRIIDKRQTISGTEYQFNSGEWIGSSTLRIINPELVELYEYLHNSGFREGVNVFNPRLRPRLVLPKGTRKRTQSSSGTLTAPSPTTPLVEGFQEIDVAATPGYIEPPGQGADQIADMSFDQEEEDGESQGSISTPPPSKKPRIAVLKREESMGLSQLSIESVSNDGDPSEQQESQGSGQASPSTSTPSSPKDIDQKSPIEDSSSPPMPTSGSKRSKKAMAVVEFNKKTENLITIYFKSGLDATGVEMFDMVLGPLRRPSKEFIAGFFYAVILSPMIDPTTIEAAIHLMDRVLTLHGPEAFQAIWDVQKRRREFADGSSSFSKASSPSDQDDFKMSTMSSRLSSTNKKPLTLKDLSSNALAGRLPSWSDIWDVIKAEFGLDTKDESKQHNSLQEHQIRLRLQGSEVAVDIEQPSNELDFEDLDGQGEGSISSEKIPEEREIREEIGRAIVSFLLRVLEQDAVLNNMSPTSFFCRDVLAVSRYSSSHAIRRTLDLAFQIIGLATSSRYFKPHDRLNPTAPSSPIKPLVKHPRAPSPWPVNERCTLNSAGMEILQLGQQIILLLVRFTQAGELFPGKGLEELAREVVSRMSKVNKDRKLPSSSVGRTASFVSPFLLERYNLDQTEVFLKTLVQGPCLLEAGTGSGASVKMRRDALLKQQQANGATTTDSVILEHDDSTGVFKSQIGTCMGSSVFVMILVDYWFRNNTTASNPGNMLNFRVVVEKYTMPGQLRPSTSASTSTASTPRANKAVRGSKRRTRGSRATAAEDANQDLSDDDQPSFAQWNAKDLEEIEWTVMMTEVLVCAWSEARGIRRKDIQNTGLEQVLFPEEVGPPSLDSYPESGWLLMSEVLDEVGGTLKTRWEVLETIIEAAILVDDLSLR